VSDIRIGWTVVLFLAALALGMAFSAICHASPPTLRETIIAAVPSLATKREEALQPDVVADAVLSATSNRQWAALLLTIASHESALSARIARGECGPHECDHGKAWGTWQQHQTPRNAEVWGSPDLNVQAREASHLARQFYNMCKSSGVPFPLSTFRAFAGSGCKMPFKGEAARMATFKRLMGRL
jgi:hypothetical protein